MNKTLAIIMTLCVLFSIGTFTVSATEDDAAAVTAQYATTKPTIDGDIDEIWNSTPSIYATFDVAEGFAQGYAKILWTEDTLYFLADITDSDTDVGVDNTANEACFWVSETKSANESYTDSAEDWNVSINQSGTYEYYSGENLDGKATWAAKLTANGYVVEMAVPRQGRLTDYKAEDRIGFALSIEDDANGDNERDNVCATTETRYWSDPSSLAEIVLVKAPAVDTAPGVPARDTPISTVIIGVIIGSVVIVVGVLIFILLKKKKAK